jgi:hypothetical protein
LACLKLVCIFAQAEAEELLQEQYPHFLPAWRRLNATVLKGDIIRYFILDSVGGLYLDMDVECFWRAEPDLRRGDSARSPDPFVSSACRRSCFRSAGRCVLQNEPQQHCWALSAVSEQRSSLLTIAGCCSVQCGGMDRQCQIS